MAIEENQDQNKQEEQLGELLTVAEVAGLLKINPQTVRNRIEAGELPAVRLGRRVRIQRSVLEELIGWQHDQADPQEDEHPEVRVDLGAAAAALDQIGAGFIKLAAAIHLEAPKGRRKRHP